MDPNDAPITFPTPFQHIILPVSSEQEVQLPTESSMSTFSMTSTVDTRIFREDNGRRFQASNDDYALPADEEEGTRLDIQHRGWKAVNGGRNYIAPIDQVLVGGGEGKRLLDIGTGNGIWAEEMAREFPKAEVIGIDLVPYEKDPAKLPPNLSLVLADCVKGIPYPDGHFDVIHARLILGGIRDWPTFLEDVVRLLKPGGLMVLAEAGGHWPLIDPAPEGVGSGFVNFMGLVTQAGATRGLDIPAAFTTIPDFMRQHPGLRDFEQKYIFLPLHPWHDDPQYRAAGAVMIDDAKLLPEAFRLLVIDACEIPASQYERLKEAFLADLNDKRVHSAIPMWHTWGWRV